MLHRVLDAFRRDSWLQLAGIGFVIVLVGVLEQPRLSTSVEFAPAGHTAPANGHRTFNINDEGPLIIELPAPSEAATHAMVARLSGREVHVKDENGNWRIMKPAFDQYGRIQDHSDTMIGLAKLSCAEDAVPEIKEAFAKLRPESRKVMCEMAAAG